MGTTTVQVADELYTLVAHDALKREPKSMRGIPTPFADDALSKGKVTVQGGHKIKVPWSFENHSLPTQLTFSNPYQQFNTFNQPQMKSGFDDWAAAVQPVFVSGLDKNHYRGKEAIADLVKHRTLTTKAHFKRAFQTAVMRGAVASGSFAPGVDTQVFSYLNPLNGIDYSTGLLEEISSGNNTVHGISRSSYSSTNYPLFHPLVFDCADAAGTYLLDRWVAIQTLAQARGVEIGSLDFYVSQAFPSHLQKVLRQPMQYANIKGGSEMYALPGFMGKELKIILNDMPQNGANTATYKVSMYGIPWGEGNGIHLRCQAGWELESMSPFVSIPGTAECSVALFKFEGQIIQDVPGNCVVGVRAESY